MMFRLFGWKRTALALNEALERECNRNVTLQKNLVEMSTCMVDHERRLVMAEDKIRELLHEYDNDNK